MFQYEWTNQIERTYLISFESFMRVTEKIQVLYLRIPKEMPYSSCLYIWKEVLNVRQDLTSPQSLWLAVHWLDIQCTTVFTFSVLAQVLYPMQ